MMAVKAGAKHVYAVEVSGIIHIAEAIIKKNKLDSKITLLKGKMEDVKLPVQEVDVIVCDWMGYILFHESMIETVIDARDRYLVKGGVILPDKATMRICGIEDAEYKEQRIDFWDNVYGLNMSCMKEGSLTEPLIDVCNPKQVITTHAKVFDLDLNTAPKDCLKFESKFSIKSKVHDFCHALVLYFTVEFSRCRNPITLSTSPLEYYTHWKQSVLYLDTPIPLSMREDIKGTIKMWVSGEKKDKTVIQVGTQFKGVTSIKQERTYKYG